LAWAALLAAGALAPAAGAGAPRIPPGYRAVVGGKLGPGVERFALTNGSHQAVHVARIAPDAPFVLRTVPAAKASPTAAGLERTSSICARVSCLAGVNGDFWEPATGLPLGGVVSGGRLLRPPAQRHDQLVLSPDGRLTTGVLRLNGTLVPTDLHAVPFTDVDVGPGPGGVVLYTSAFGPATPAGGARVDLTVELVRPQQIYLGRTTLVRMVGLDRTARPTPIPPNGAVLEGRGPDASQLADLWTRAREGVVSDEALLRLESTPSALESIGGSPVLLRDGRPVFQDAAASFVRGRHPRTLVGRTPSGEALLVTVDGRQPGYSDGMSLAEAAQLMTQLGAVDAINLDGGGSTTFVERGAVANRPSDRAVRRAGRQRIVHQPGRGDVVLGNVERPVAVALVVVPRTPTETKVDGQTLFRDMDLPRVVQLAAPHSSDPGSVPPGALPAIVYTERRKADHTMPVALGFFSAATVATFVSRRRLRRLLPVGLRLRSEAGPAPGRTAPAR
jgi:hypothetical protein